MSSLSPVFAAGEAGKNVRMFLKDNKDMMWQIFQPFMIGIAGMMGVSILLVAISHMIYGVFSIIFSLAITYLYGCFSISWHRAAILGTENMRPVNPLKPRKSELMFILMPFFLIVPTIILYMICAFILAKILPVPLVMILGFVAMGVIGWVFLRLSFYFPAKAVEASVSLKDAFYLTKGYVWKLLCSGFFSSWRIMLVVMAYMFITALIAFGLLAMSGVNAETLKSGTGTFLHALIEIIINLPIMLYFNPILYALGVGCLSNYYMHAIQNKH